jgi:hypothetical protein
MKNLSNYSAIVLALCFSLSTAGNDLFAQRPYSLQKHHPNKHKYYYYPKQNVYYDPVSSVYFVWEQTYWKPVSHLPGRYITVTYSNAPRFELWIASAHPYYYNPEHRRTYYEYRVAHSAPSARLRVESRPKPNVSFHLEINSAPQPVYVEERYVIVKERHDNGHHYGHHPGRGHGKGHGKGKGHRH